MRKPMFTRSPSSSEPLDYLFIPANILDHHTTVTGKERILQAVTLIPLHDLKGLAKDQLPFRKQ